MQRAPCPSQPHGGLRGECSDRGSYPTCKIPFPPASHFGGQTCRPLHLGCLGIRSCLTQFVLECPRPAITILELVVTAMDSFPSVGNVNSAHVLDVFRAVWWLQTPSLLRVLPCDTCLLCNGGGSGGEECTHDHPCHSHETMDLASLQSRDGARRPFAGQGSHSVTKREVP